MGDVEVVIDCRTCYRLQNCGGRYYCPFAGLQPCFGGIHTTHVPVGKTSSIRCAAAVVEVDKQKIIADRINQVVELTANGVTTKDIAKHLGISLSSVYRYQREGLVNDD